MFLEAVVAPFSLLYFSQPELNHSCVCLNKTEPSANTDMFEQLGIVSNAS
jgi:hypothetical protein